MARGANGTPSGGAAAGEFPARRLRHRVAQRRLELASQLMNEFIGEPRQHRRDGLAQAQLQHQVGVALQVAQDTLDELCGR